MTKEKLEERIKTLETDRENCRNQFLATEGAILDCKHWLQQIEEPDGQAVADGFSRPK